MNGLLDRSDLNFQITDSRTIGPFLVSRFIFLCGEEPLYFLCWKIELI